MNESALARIGIYVTIRARKQFKHDGRLWKRGKIGALPNAVAHRLIAIGRAERVLMEQQVPQHESLEKGTDH